MYVQLLPKANLLRTKQARQWWESGKFADWNGRGVGDCYGAEHLARMIGKLIPPLPPFFSPIHKGHANISSNHSLAPRDDRADQHGRPIRRTPEGRNLQILHLALAPQPRLLRRQIREA